VAKNYIQGFYKPINPQKYVGDPNQIVYRSSYELRLFKYCDMTESVVEWGSEEMWIKYFNPVTERFHRYFPDAYLKIQESSGEVKQYIVEVKPKRQTMSPNPSPKKKTKTWINEMKTYQTNIAKWDAAKQFCNDNKMEFKIITESELGIK
jgi:hypothetical protein